MNIAKEYFKIWCLHQLVYPKGSTGRTHLDITKVKPYITCKHKAGNQEGNWDLPRNTVSKQAAGATTSHCTLGMV